MLGRIILVLDIKHGKGLVSNWTCFGFKMINFDDDVVNEIAR